MVTDPLDPLLVPYVAATTEAEAAERLAALVQSTVLPLARRIAGHRLRAWRSPAAPQAAEIDDVVSSAMLTLVERLQALRGGEVTPIASVQDYAASVVYSSCAHVLRARFPERTRLKNRLRYVLKSHERLALWTGEDGVLYCGVASHRGSAAAGTDQARVAALLEQAATTWADLSPQALGNALAAVLAAGGGPVPFDALVAAVAGGTAIHEPRHTEDVASVAAVVEPREFEIHRKRVLARAWDEIRTLPLGQRTALLLNLRNTTGAGLLWLLPVVGVATLRQIASVLEIDPAEFARLWRSLPLDDDSIAARLGCARQQVINYRMAARKRLVNRLRGWRDEPRARADGRVNLARVSTS